MVEPTLTGLPTEDEAKAWYLGLKRDALQILRDIQEQESEGDAALLGAAKATAAMYARYWSKRAQMAALKGDDGGERFAATQHHEYLKQVARLAQAHKLDLLPQISKRLEMLDNAANQLQALP